MIERKRLIKLADAFGEECVCDKAYSMRGLEDPYCNWHERRELVEDILEDLNGPTGRRTAHLVFDEIADKPPKIATRLLLSSNALNSRGKWARHEITQFWRPLAKIKAASLGVEPMGRVRVRINFRYSTNHRRDTHNMSPVLKACLDGVVAAGLIKDDDDRYVESVTYHRRWPNGPRQVVLTLEEIE